MEKLQKNIAICKKGMLSYRNNIKRSKQKANIQLLIISLKDKTYKMQLIKQEIKKEDLNKKKFTEWNNNITRRLLQKHKDWNSSYLISTTKITG